MSAFAGIVNFDGASVDRRVLDGLARSLTRLGPDGGGYKQTQNLGVVFRAFHTDSESKTERQPLVSPRGHILAWDGRLDNRPELIAQLRDYVDHSCADVEIVMAAHAKWDAGFLSHLVGDFALSLWEPATRTLTLARDAFGTRPLYYEISSHRIAWSSDLGSLVDLSTQPIEVDREYIAGYLSNAPELHRTAYKNIHCVEPGCALIVRDGHVERRNFWRPDVKRSIRYRSDAEYEEHFRVLFRDAVRCRLRADGPVWAELSGGLDSSSIVCMADQIIRSGEAETAKLETVSYVYDHSPASDERRFIREVENQRGQAGHYFHEDESVGRFLDLDFETIVRPNPIYRFTARHDWVRTRMQQTRSRVLLSGVAGDNLMWSGVDISPQLADLLVQLKLPSLHRQVTAWSQATRDSYTATLWRGAVRPIFSQTLFTPRTPAPTLIDRNFAKLMKTRERTVKTSDPWGFELPSERAYASIISMAIRAVASCYYSDRVATEYRFPFLHRPLVEFLLAIPIEQKVRPGETRSLQRRALAQVLPTAILRRQSKRWAMEALCRSLANNWREVEWLFKEPRVCDYGFVDARAFAEAATRIRHGAQNPAANLSVILSIELWLRALESRQSSSLSEIKLAS
ncbi:MAG TPA: asparagine synthase-related protein [Pyrinomonadaceae bacterium]|nr:asparagine synthase-related protein [Pyrinomonadaceae bacterium]